MRWALVLIHGNIMTIIRILIIKIYTPFPDIP
jgi:hypothetical protein